ncbi:APC family permease [Corynebacterium lubricantis]|uniref:APC family permease n=1 Tax=Corynebacterium lubricantis TaxID=541095 RepID=UPI00036A71C9|nr:APC family permease [Corynebacterium lubricantis]
MCLSGVDYFSTLGYQPSIAIIAVGALAPPATLVLVLVTILCAVPVYRRVARHSPHGMGSIALIEGLTHGWLGKLIVLVLLGFAATDFMITITLSSADASAHLLHTTESPWQLPLTIGLIVLLALVFMRGFKEAVSVAVVLVSTYLTLTLIVLGAGVYQLYQHPELIGNWANALAHSHASPWAIVLISLIVFPKLALGLSGFETGVSVMPLIRANSTEERVRGAHRLLTTSALIMCVFLLLSSFVAVTLIPAAQFQAGGTAEGRALAWVAHEYLGSTFGAVYDISTVAILWFAGASAMSGLLALIPKYLPRYGMAPRWAQRSRPMVGVLAAAAIVVTLVFRASVTQQAGAYATGVLVVITSGAIAVTLYAKGAARGYFAVVSVIFIATTVANIIERPDGIRVAAWFILCIIVFSFASRMWRAYELRDVGVTWDEKAETILSAHTTGNRINIVPFAPHLVTNTDEDELRSKDQEIRQNNHLDEESVVYLEIQLRDPSAFSEQLHVEGRTDEDGRAILSVCASSVANSLAVIAIHIGKNFNVLPTLYFDWAQGSPWLQTLRYIFLGKGQVATETREILRRAIADESKRPRIHVG